ncbi:hypothetical protein like AT4G17390 [Hibiscus trionum]|uniref:Ribosomal protein L2 n=1 Tax=Hibiscus trionum TaxID=183268 RepID=A0A9W7JC12_HIBTR|nr:hypothetical protein like AT4G17390 [Hibiscus trionum]
MRYILLTSTLRLSWLVLHTMPSAMTQGLTGSAIQFISTASAGMKNRGLHHKNRPSRRATWKRNNTFSLRRYR